MACIVGKAFAAFFVAVCISMVTSFGVPFPSRIMLAHSMRNKCLKMRTDGIDLSTQIFCNVELNADYIEAVGFDLDFTLAQYNKDYGRLIFDGTKEKLSKFGYPQEVLSFEWRSDSFLRGLVIDKERGNVLKIDRHKYVRSAMHGSTVLPAALRKSMYNKEVVSFSEDNYVNIDSMYLLIDAQLFSHLVDLKDRTPSMHSFSYERIYSDVRAAVEGSLREGKIGKSVMAHPEKYITHDEGVVPTLQQLRAAGKKTFLLTNSFWNYTNAIMDYVVHGGGEYKDIDWKDLFHVIIVGANKPAFLTNDALNLFKVDGSGHLYNMDDRDALQCSPTTSTRTGARKSPLALVQATAPQPAADVGIAATAVDSLFTTITSSSAPSTSIGPQSPSSSTSTSTSSSSTSTSSSSDRDRDRDRCSPQVYQGGYWQDLHRLLAVSYGDKILFVGDQMFSDILRSKRTLGWRTCLVVPELQHETFIANRERALYAQVLKLRQRQHEIDEHTDQLYAAFEEKEGEGKGGHADEAGEGGGALSSVALLKTTHRQADEIKKEIREALARYDEKFNENWGQLFKAGLHDSRFAKQVRNYACLYTSKVSNLRYVSPHRTFRPVNDFMSPDQVMGGDALTQGYPVSDSAGD